MSISFFIIAFEYDGEFSPDIIADIKMSDYEINIEEYKQQLLLRWKDIIFDDITPLFYILSWQIIMQRTPTVASRGWYRLRDDQQTLVMKSADREFALWHREFVPAHVRLFITGENMGKAMELKPNTTAEELDQVFT